MSVLRPKLYQPFQLEQVSEFVLRQLWDQPLTFPALELSTVELQQATDFLARENSSRLALYGGHGMFRSLAQHTRIITPGVKFRSTL
jgi:hypothetical protein